MEENMSGMLRLDVWEGKECVYRYCARNGECLFRNAGSIFPHKGIFPRENFTFVKFRNKSYPRMNQHLSRSDLKY